MLVACLHSWHRSWKIRAYIAAKAGWIRSYSAAVSGSAGRVVFSLAYFVILANALPIGEFGIFATASATGVVISRLLAFGFISPLYRIAAVKPRLLGAYFGGFLLFALLSLPLIVLVSLLVHWLFLAEEIDMGSFALVMVSETIAWRGAEAIIIVNNGLGRFGRAAILVIAGTALRALAASIFTLNSGEGLAQWAWYYLAANLAALILAVHFFYPGQRLRITPALYWRKLVDSAAVASAEILFYLQTELDKLLVLTMGGASLAGLYAIAMRLVDLTTIPLRAFIMMLVQAAMRRPRLLERKSFLAGVEAGIFVLSTLGLAVLALVLSRYPHTLGRNIGEIAPILGFALFVPAFRNLAEYQSELLYARGRSVIRTWNLLLLACAKGILLWLLLRVHDEPKEILAWLNGIYLVLYLLSFAVTYTFVRQARRVV